MRYRLLRLLLVVTLLATGCPGKEEEKEVRPEPTGPVSVGTYKAGSHTFHRRIEISADLLANKQVTLISKVPGEVKKVLVAEGDMVKKGDLVVKLDQKDFRLAVRQAKAQLAAAQAGVTAAEVGLETVTAKHGRLTKLRDKQIISESAYEDIQGSQRSTKAQVTLAEAQLQLAGVGLDSAKLNLSYTEIRAPFDGRVARRMVDEGARLNAMPPTPIATIVDADKIKIVGAVSERDLSFVAADTAVEITIEALAEPPIKATVERVEPIVDPKSRTAGIHVVLDNEKGKLQPGMSARLTVDLGNRESVAVPDDVIIRSEIEDNTGVVFIVKDNRVTRKEVHLGVREGQLREITSGVKAGDMVVRGGQEKLSDGEQVTIYKGKGSQR